MAQAGRTRTYFEVHVQGIAREVYATMAKDADDAKRQFERGLLTKPLLSEVEGADVVKVVERSLDEQ